MSSAARENSRVRARLTTGECLFFHFCPPTRQFSGFPVSTHQKIPLRYQHRLPLNYLHFKHQLLTNTCIIANLWQTLFIFLLSELIIWLIWMNFVQGQRHIGKWYKLSHGFPLSLSYLPSVLLRRTFVKAVWNDCYPLHACLLLAQEHLLWTVLNTFFLHEIKNINEKNGKFKTLKQSLMAIKGVRRMVVPKNCTLTPSWVQVWNAARGARSVGMRTQDLPPGRLLTLAHIYKDRLQHIIVAGDMNHFLQNMATCSGVNGSGSSGKAHEDAQAAEENCSHWPLLWITHAGMNSRFMENYRVWVAFFPSLSLSQTLMIYVQSCHPNQ